MPRWTAKHNTSVKCFDLILHTYTYIYCIYIFLFYVYILFIMSGFEALETIYQMLDNNNRCCGGVQECSVLQCRLSWHEYRLCERRLSALPKLKELIGKNLFFSFQRVVPQTAGSPKTHHRLKRITAHAKAEVTKHHYVERQANTTHYCFMRNDIWIESVPKHKVPERAKIVIGQEIFEEVLKVKSKVISSQDNSLVLLRCCCWWWRWLARAWGAGGGGGSCCLCFRVRWGGGALRFGLARGRGGGGSAAGIALWGEQVFWGGCLSLCFVFVMLLVHGANEKKTMASRNFPALRIQLVSFFWTIPNLATLNFLYKTFRPYLGMFQKCSS